MILLFLGCLSERPTGEDEVSAEADTDADADSDTDTDTDADADSDADSDTDTDADTDRTAFLDVTMGTSEGDRELAWTREGGQFIECVDFGDGWLWLRFADEDTQTELSIDVCNYAGSGEYMAFDPTVQDCPSTSPAFDVWWIEGGATIWTSAVGEPCELALTADDVGLGGDFACALKALEDQPDDGRGERVLDLGAFWCELVDFE
jgi:hypothetical protein